jgi:hydroxymethylbilane synthase
LKPLSIGTRGSALALWQAEHVRQLLRERTGADAAIVVIKTTGDREADLPFGQVGTMGMFLKELEDALREGRVDLAVHSLKDVPTEMPAGLILAAFLEREDVRDALVSRSGEKLSALPLGARVGTSSLRRQSQLRHYRADLGIAELRGNVDTRSYWRRLDSIGSDFGSASRKFCQ